MSPVQPSPNLSAVPALQPSLRALSQPVPREVPAPQRPFAVQLQRNQVLSRAFLDAFGWGGGAIVFARNKYERIERALDLLSWWVIGLGTPFLLEKVVCQAVNKRLAAKLPQHFTQLDGSRKTPLRLPLELLDEATHRQALKTFAQRPDIVQEVEKLGLNSIHALEDPALRRILRHGKLSLMFIDLALMASKGQLYYWGKNAVTRKLSGQSGYSGEFSYTDEAFRKKESSFFERTKKARAIASTTIGYGSAVALPLLLNGLLIHKTPADASAGIVGQAKRLLPHFNYTDTVFMSKWVIAWHNQFNWMLPSLLSARDGHELRENFVRTNLIDFFFFLGDSLMMGGAAKLTEAFGKKKLEGSLFDAGKKVFGRFRQPRALHEIYEAHGQDSRIYQVARRNFWGAMSANAAILSVLAPLVSNWFTRKKVEAQQAQEVPPPPVPPVPQRLPDTLGKVAAVTPSSVPTALDNTQIYPYPRFVDPTSLIETANRMGAPVSRPSDLLPGLATVVY